MEFIRFLRRFALPIGGVLLSLIFFALDMISRAQQIVEFGLPSWALRAAGELLLVGAVLVFFYQIHRRLEAAESPESVASKANAAFEFAKAHSRVTRITILRDSQRALQSNIDGVQTRLAELRTYRPVPPADGDTFHFKMMECHTSVDYLERMVSRFAAESGMPSIFPPNWLIQDYSDNPTLDLSNYFGNEASKKEFLNCNLRAHILRKQIMTLNSIIGTAWNEAQATINEESWLQSPQGTGGGKQP